MKPMQVIYRLAAFALLALVAGCATPPAQRMVAATYDLSNGAEDYVFAQGRLLAGVEVFGASWLSDDAMYYRLNYTDPAGRFAYTESQWSGSVAEQTAIRLQRSLPDKRTGICRLRVDLDDLIQEFTSPSDSHVLLSARATLLGPGSPNGPYQHAFRIVRHAPSANAKGGVIAAQAAVGQLAREIDQWLDAAQVGDKNFAKRCR